MMIGSTTLLLLQMLIMIWLLLLPVGWIQIDGNGGENHDNSIFG